MIAMSRRYKGNFLIIIDNREFIKLTPTQQKDLLVHEYLYNTDMLPIKHESFKGKASSHKKLEAYVKRLFTPSKLEKAMK